MKMLNRIYALLLVSFFFTSCDPVHTINFVNETDAPAKVRIHLVTGFEEVHLKQEAIGDSIILNINPNETGSLSFGVGTWSDREIEEIIQSLKSLEIETADIKTTYKSKNSIRKIMKENAEGFWWKTHIEIPIK